MDRAEDVDQRNWDPKPHEREYVRDRDTGDLGWKVRRDGKVAVRLDRPMQEIICNYVPGQWPVDRERRPMTPNQVAQIAFAADRMYLLFNGKAQESRKEWLALKDEEKIAWVDDGPQTSDPLRANLYKVILRALKSAM